MAARTAFNAEIEVAAAYELLVRVRTMWTPPGGALLSIEEMATNRRCSKLQDFANDLLDKHDEPAVDVCEQHRTELTVPDYVSQ